VEITIEHRYCGPPESGNGGWVCGTVAASVPTTLGRPSVTVRLSSPPPLDRPMALEAEPADGTITLRLVDRGHLVASGTASADLVDDVPPTVPLDVARAAEARFEGLADHPFPTCFACGTDRDPGEALCLRPGPLDDGTGRYAATWVPREVSGPLVWAALDCPSGWSAGIAGRPMVLGTMTARVLALPGANEPHVIMAWQRGSEGRKHHSGSALFSPGGELLGRAEATWVAVDPATVRPEERS